MEGRGTMTARIPERGRPWNELSREMTDLERDDLDWRGGRHAAFVWHADDEVERVAREAYALFMTETASGCACSRACAAWRVTWSAMVAGLLGGDASVTGSMTSGGTKSIFLAAHAAREWARRQRPDVAAPEIVAAFSAHPAIDKAAHYLGMRVVRVPTGVTSAPTWRRWRRPSRRGRSCVRLGAHLLAGRRRPDRGAGRAGGVARSLAPRRRLRGRHPRSLRARARLPGAAVRLDLPGVASLSADLHKSGYAAKGASVILYRDAAREACGRYEFNDWPTGRYAVPTFAGTRPGGAIAAAWAVMHFLGAEGYRRIAATVMQARERLVAGLARIDGLRVSGEPDCGRWPTARRAATSTPSPTR